jgi:predicted secreted Zn-dependent protease
MKQSKKILAGTLTSAMLISALALPGVASASTKGRENTALALGALTALELVKGQSTNALLAGAATAFAYSKYEDSKKNDQRRDRWENSRNWRETRRSYLRHK